jgi:uncharacterized protein (TIGR03083 family)
MDDTELYATIDAERTALADLLAGLDPEQWEHPSLCAGWRVRDVAAHVALTASSPARAVVAMVRSGFDFNRMIDGTARRHAAQPTAQLVAEIRALAGVRRRPPGTTRLDPLNDVLVHTQDIARPLGLHREMPVEAATACASLVWNRSFPFHAQRRIGRRTLVATDTDWSRGEGPTVEAPIAEILMLLTGRTPVPVPRT